MRIKLRKITIDDGRLIVKWRNSNKVLRHCMNKERISLESNEEFFKQNIETGRYKQFIVERLEEDFSVCSYPIGTVYLKDIDNLNRRCELCVFTSDDEEWNDSSIGIAISMLLDKAFNEYNMHKVYTYVFSEFADEIHLIEEAGFKYEATLHNEAISLNGLYVDVYRYCIEK